MTTEYYLKETFILLNFICGIDTRQPNHFAVKTLEKNKWIIKFPEYKESLIISIDNDEINFEGPQDLIDKCIEHIN